MVSAPKAAAGIGCIKNVDRFALTNPAWASFLPSEFREGYGLDERRRFWTLASLFVYFVLARLIDRERTHEIRSIAEGFS